MLGGAIGIGICLGPYSGIYVYIYIYIYNATGGLEHGEFPEGRPEVRYVRRTPMYVICMYMCVYIYIYIHTSIVSYIMLYYIMLCYYIIYADAASHGRGDDTVGNPHRAQNYKFEFFELILLLKLDEQLPVKQFEAAVSQSTVPSPPLSLPAFGNIKVGQREYPKGPSVKRHEICSDPISADPICYPPLLSMLGTILHCRPCCHVLLLARVIVIMRPLDHMLVRVICNPILSGSYFLCVGRSLAWHTRSPPIKSFPIKSP